MMVRPYGVRMSTVARSPDGCVGYQRSATSSMPSGIFAIRPRSTETAVLWGGGGEPDQKCGHPAPPGHLTTPLFSLWRREGCPVPSPSGGVEQPEDDRI